MFVPLTWTPERIVLFLLILWATTGLTLIHLAVLGVRLFRPLRPRAASVVPVDTGPRPTITFVIPVYNDRLTVGPTIESVLRQSVPVDRILVVNDGSTDGTREVLESFRDRGVDVMHLPRNVGKSRALDAGIQTVDTDLVAITDADSIVDVDYVKEMVDRFRDPELAAMAGAVESIPHTWVTASRHIEYMMTVRIDRDAESTMNALVVLPGVSSTYRTKVLRELGFEFDTIAEDFDLTFRMQRAGHKIAMNLRAKVYTSDPPTLSAYYRQLVRWYTDFFLVIKKHRAVLGKKVFGTLEVPMLLLNAVVSSVLFFVVPIVLAFRDASMFPAYILTAVAFDLALVLIAWRVYHRTDVFWALLSRFPTRAVSRFAFLLAMTRVAIGKPGLAWDKLERRGTTDFLAGSAGAAPRPIAIDELPASGALSELARRAGLALLLVGGLVAPLFSPAIALALLAGGLTFLALRSFDVAYRGARGRAARVATLVLAEVIFLGAAAFAVGALSFEVPLAWRIAALASAAQLVFLALAWPWRAPAGRWLRWRAPVGHAAALSGSAALAIGSALAPPLALYALGFGVLALGSRGGEAKEAALPAA